jgi:hypothetical protein
MIILVLNKVVKQKFAMNSYEFNSELIYRLIKAKALENYNSY